MVRAVKVLLSALVLSALALPAAAQRVPCLDRDQLAKRLSSEFSEAMHAVGLTADGKVIEIYTSPRGTWTLVTTLPDGRSCLVSWGEAWQVVPAKDTGPVS